MILFDIQAGGCSIFTDHVHYGVEGSRFLAKQDLYRAKKLRWSFDAAEEETQIPAALLMGIASRESRMGVLLTKTGYGDNGNAYGMMQIDVRSHSAKKLYGACSPLHVIQAAEILVANYHRVKHKFPKWTPAYQLKGAVAAYNFGLKNLVTIEHMDDGTTHDDYSSDVWERAKYYHEQIYPPVH